MDDSPRVGFAVTPQGAALAARQSRVRGALGLIGLRTAQRAHLARRRRASSGPQAA